VFVEEGVPPSRQKALSDRTRAEGAVVSKYPQGGRGHFGFSRVSLVGCLTVRHPARQNPGTAGMAPRPGPALSDLENTVTFPLEKKIRSEQLGVNAGAECTEPRQKIPTTRTLRSLELNSHKLSLVSKNPRLANFHALPLIQVPDFARRTAHRVAVAKFRFEVERRRDPLGLSGPNGPREKPPRWSAIRVCARQNRALSSVWVWIPFVKLHSCRSESEFSSRPAQLQETNQFWEA